MKNPPFGDPAATTPEKYQKKQFQPATVGLTLVFAKSDPTPDLQGSDAGPLLQLPPRGHNTSLGDSCV